MAELGTYGRKASFLHSGSSRQLPAEGYNVPAYYLERITSWQRWSGTWYFSYRPPGAARPLRGLAAYRAAIDSHYFSLIMLNFRDTALTDSYITADINRAGGYRVIAKVPSSAGQYTIWAYKPRFRDE